MRLRLMVLLAALAAGCSTTPPAPPSPPPPPPLSPEATAVFARAETQGPGAVLVVNLDALEQLGLAGKGPTMRQLGGVAITVMAQLSASKDPDDHEASLFARSTVLAAMLRQWADWPGVRRFALILPTSRAVHQGSTVVADELVGALAVDGGSADNPELLAGVAALVRASVWELVREDMEARVAMRGQDLCIESRELGVPFCLRPRRGLILFGTPQALDSFEALPPRVAPPATPGEAPLLIGLRVDLGTEGRGRLSFTGRDAVRIQLNLESASPKHVSMLDTLVKKGLAEYDGHQARVRERVGAALAEAQRALARDPAAPPSLKQTATTLTADKVVDEYGYWAQARQSLQIASTQDSFSLALTVPAGAVKDLSDQLSHGGAAVPVMGAMSAMAVPGFLKLMFRQAQPEAKANLKAAYIAQKSFMAEQDRWGRTFEEIGFLPEQGRRYTYCMDKQCLPCDRQGCKVSPPPSPCQGLASVGQRVDEGFTVCAYGNLDSDDTWDVWVIDEEGEPQHLSDDAD